MNSDQVKPGTGFLGMLEKALHDPTFAELVDSDPNTALTRAGITPTAKKVDALRSAVNALQGARGAIDECIIDNI